MRALEMEDGDAGFVRMRSESRRNLAAFWILGVFNNAAYVIMLAGAQAISAGGVGIVYLSAIVPGIILKASAPYFLHTVPYAARVLACAALMSASFAVVGLSTSRGPQLAGVVLASLQGALGEASFLALSSYYNADATITAWSSGTGFAGVFGYTWVAGLHVALGFSFQQTLAAAQVTAGAFVAAYFLLLEPPEARAKQVRDMIDADEQLVGAAMEALGDGGGSGGGYGSSGGGGGDVEGYSLAVPPRGRGLPGSSYGRGDAEEEEGDDDDDNAAALLPPTARDRTPPRAALAKRSKAHRMSARERLTRTLALWPYTVPLFAVYAAEYTMQAGVWSAIGLPDVTDPAARRRFYSASNWCYQAGVFVSRSSGMVCRAGRRALWVMPAIQIGLLAMFLGIATTHFWYDWSLLAGAVAAGLLGGAVYVNAFTLIAREVEPQYREFSLGAASVADSAGIAVADVAAIFIQGCLFKINGLSGADFKC